MFVCNKQKQFCLVYTSTHFIYFSQTVMLQTRSLEKQTTELYNKCATLGIYGFISLVGHIKISGSSVKCFYYKKSNNNKNYTYKVIINLELLLHKRK